MRRAIWTLVGAVVLSGAVGTGDLGAEPPEPAGTSAQGAPAFRTGSFTLPLIDISVTPPQRVIPGTLLVKRHHHEARQARADNRFADISATGSNDVPEAALRAYHHAADVLASTEPSCQVPWTFLAAIGRVESDHGRYGGSQLGSDGVSRPEILGLRLDGAGAVAAVPDTDNGRLDHDKIWDRAVGPMQFIPGTWRSVARDADGDGVASPNDIDDAALAAGTYLCGAGNLADTSGMARAAFRYNPSDYYVSLVLAFEQGYRTGVFVIPSPPPPPGADKPRHQHNQHKPHQVRTTTTHQVRTAHHAVTPTKTATHTTTTTPTPKPTPTTPPAATAPKLVDLTGTWQACGTDFCLDGTHLDLGPAGIQGNHAAADFDGDGTIESNADEFAGLAAAGGQVTVQVVQDTAPAVVYLIAGKDFRNADGSFR